MTIRDEVEREAEQYATRFQPAHGDDRPFVLKGAETFRAGVVRGYVDALTKREPTDAEVEAAAKALFSEVFRSVPDVTWESVSEDVRDNYRVKARAALRAARGQA